MPARSADDHTRESQERLLRGRLQMAIGEIRENMNRQQRLVAEIDRIIDLLLPLEEGREEGK
jgi:hypothetical protein